MYSLPIRETLAAFTMASAASIEPMRPFVSTIPNASAGMARTLTDCRRCGNYTIIIVVAHDQSCSRPVDLFICDRFRRYGGRVRCLPAQRGGGPSCRDAQRRVEPHARA